MFSEQAPPENRARIAPSAKYAGALAAALALLLVFGCATPQPIQYVVMGMAFLIAAAVSFVGLLSRSWIERSESLRGDLICFVAVCFSQIVMLLFFVVVGPLFLSSFWVILVFFAWGLLVLVYALATAVPGVRMILVVGLFLAVPLSLLAVHLYHQQQQARRNVLDKRAIELGTGARKLQDSQRNLRRDELK